MPRANPCIFIGYHHGQKAYTISDLVTKTISISRDVKFFENIFPLNSSDKSLPSIVDSFIPIPIYDSDIQNPHFTPETNFVPDSDNNVSSSASPLHDSPIQEPFLRRTTRISQPPIHLQHFVCNSAITEASSSCFHTVTNLCICLSSKSHSISLVVTKTTSQLPIMEIELDFYHEAKGKPQWEEAMRKDLIALNANHTWEIVKLPK